jgi:hypothetical protein
MALPETQEKLQGASVTPFAGDQAGFKRFFLADIEKWRGVVRRASLKLE